MLLTQLTQLCPQVPIAVSPHVHGLLTETDCVRALQRGAAFGARWTVYLEDDAYLAPAFPAEVVRLLQQAGSLGFLMVSFYSNAQRTLTAMAAGKGSCVIEPRYFWASVCVAVPSAMVPAIAAFAPGWYRDHPQHWHASDLLLAAFCASRCSDILVCVPSPVQHRDEPSTLRHMVKTRRYSRTFRAAYGPVPRLPGQAAVLDGQGPRRPGGRVA
ncbi:MAG: hypothetical protein EHM56_09145 [Chloroflexi bacterium]|nr:MAG: hypothetical protein EHM56_09145 [Chloroflexota bacterium]